MKKTLLTLLLCFGALSLSYSQTLLSYITNKVSSNLSSTLRERYKGNVNITDAQETGDYIIVAGTFSYQIQTWFGPGNTVTRRFKARVKTILDDVQVAKLCYVYIVYGPHDPIRKCKCTDGTYETRYGELFVE